MYLRKQKKPNGRVYLSVVQSYRTAEGKPRSKTLWSLGYLDELERDHPDPIAHFQRIIDELNSANEENKDEAMPVSITFSPHAKIPLAAPVPIEAGAAIVLATLYRDLELKQVLNSNATPSAQANSSPCGKRLERDDLGRITELLVWNRIVHPQRIAAAWASRASLPGLEALSLDDVFAGVTMLGTGYAQYRDVLTKTAEAQRLDTPEPWAYCFVINHYVESARFENPDHTASWQNRSNPIVQIAIMTDSRGLPLDYSVFDTNLATSLSLFPAVRELCTRHPNLRLIVVADKSIGSSSYELGFLADKGHGFVLLQSMRKGKRSSRDWVLDTAGYTPLGEDGSRYKQRMDIRTIENGSIRKRPESIAVKEVAVWLRAAFESTRFNRFREVKRTENAFSNGAPSGGIVRPLRARYGDGDAKFGATDDHVWDVYWEKIAADEAMDGYINILTSELDLSALDVVNLYRSLQSIRVFFAPMPGEWSSTPQALSRQDYLEAHFLIAFLAACVTQLLHERTGKHFADESLRVALARLTGTEVSPGQYFFNYRSRLSDGLAEEANIDLSRPLMSASELSRLMQTARR